MSITWDRDAAAHLARRAGFGATPAELDRYLQMGLDATVDFFVNYDSVDNSVMEGTLIGLTLAIPPSHATYDLTNITGVQKWFLHRMAYTARPLEEKMTFFLNSNCTWGVGKRVDSRKYGRHETDWMLTVQGRTCWR